MEEVVHEMGIVPMRTAVRSVDSYYHVQHIVGDDNHRKKSVMRKTNTMTVNCFC